MTSQGRSLDDLPLAAYATGMTPDDALDELDAELEPEPELAADVAALPSPMTAQAAAALAAGAYDDGRAEALALEGEPSRQSRWTLPAFSVRLPALAMTLPTLPIWLANPRAHTRDPRLLMTGVIAVGAVMLTASLVFGGAPAGPVPGAGASRAPVAAATPAPPSGDATVEISGKPASTYALAGTTGGGPAAGGRIAATWSDATGASLALSGPASPGTRTTDATFSLTWTTLVEGSPVTFTSTSGECTVGMALQPKAVTGSFICKRLRSSDGKVTVEVHGTYRT